MQFPKKKSPNGKKKHLVFLYNEKLVQNLGSETVKKNRFGVCLVFFSRFGQATLMMLERIVSHVKNPPSKMTHPGMLAVTQNCVFFLWENTILSFEEISLNFSVSGHFLAIFFIGHSQINIHDTSPLTSPSFPNTKNSGHFRGDFNPHGLVGTHPPPAVPSRRASSPESPNGFWTWGQAALHSTY